MNHNINTSNSENNNQNNTDDEDNDLDNNDTDNNDDIDTDSKKNRKLVDISLFTIPTDTTIITDFNSSSSPPSPNKDTKIITESSERISNEWYHRIEKMTKGYKKNKNLKILKDVKIHNFWDNIFRRKAIMAPYFSETAFGSDADKLIENRNIWEDPHFIKKYGKKNKNEDN